MLYQNLMVPIIALGGTIIVIWLASFHYFNTKINDQIQDRMILMFSSQEITNILENIRSERMSIEMLKDFYLDISKIWKSRQIFQKIWVVIPICGILFIITGFLLGFQNDFLLFNYLPFTSFVFYLFIISNFLLIMGVFLLIMLGKRLI